jgi:hypothetical protein
MPTSDEHDIMDKVRGVPMHAFDQLLPTELDPRNSSICSLVGALIRRERTWSGLRGFFLVVMPPKLAKRQT